MKVRDIIKCLQDFHDLDEELIVAWWDKECFYGWSNDDGEQEPVPQETWDAVASHYVESDFVMDSWKEDIYRDLHNYCEREDQQ